jgi:hypothetical protein
VTPKNFKGLHLPFDIELVNLQAPVYKMPQKLEHFVIENIYSDKMLWRCEA